METFLKSCFIISVGVVFISILLFFVNVILIGFYMMTNVPINWGFHGGLFITNVGIFLVSFFISNMLEDIV